MSAGVWIAVAAAGALCAMLRVSVDGLVNARLAGRLSERGAGLVIGTFVVNVSGAFILGLVDGLAVSPDESVIIGTAAIGSYTTFSTWMAQTASLGADAQRRIALLNIGASVLVGFAAVLLGRVVGAAL